VSPHLGSRKHRHLYLYMGLSGVHNSGHNVDAEDSWKWTSRPGYQSQQISARSQPQTGRTGPLAAGHPRTGILGKPVRQIQQAWVRPHSRHVKTAAYAQKDILVLNPDPSPEAGGSITLPPVLKCMTWLYCVAKSVNLTQGSPWPPPQIRRYDDRILPIPAMLVMPRTRVGQWEHAEGGSPVTKGGVNPFSPPLFRRPDRNREKEVPPLARPDSVNTLALLTPVLEHACTTCQQTRPPPSATSPHPLPLLAFG
jgi:hypothetical protein